MSLARRWSVAAPAAAAAIAAAIIPGTATIGAPPGAPALLVREIAPVVLVPPPVPSPPEPVFSTDRLQALIEPLIGSPCDPEKAAGLIARRYRFLGYIPSVEAVCDDGVLRVRVREGSHTVELITCDAEDLSRIGVAPAGPPATLYPVPPGAPRAVLLGLVRTRPGDVYNHARYRTDREALLKYGYTIAFVGGEPSAGGWGRGAYLIQSIRPQPSAAKADTGEKNYLGGSAAYGPTHGGSVGFLYQRDDLFGRYDQLSVSPMYSAALGGSLGYRAPLLARRDSPARLYELDVEAFSNFTNNRILAGARTDERRTGASVSLGWRRLGAGGPRRVALSTGIRHERTDLDPPLPGDPGEDLTAVRLGLDWEWRHADRWPHFAWRVDPAVDVALSVAGGDRVFVRPSLDSIFHTRHLSGIETDLHLFAGSIDRDVPTYELWTLGGGRSVRGYPEDFRLGRHVAALQGEIWFPILPDPEAAAARSPTRPDSVPYSPPAARMFKAAVFADGGVMNGTADGVNEAIAGAGVGLRILFPRQPLVIRLDYGRGLVGPDTDSHFYAGLSFGF